MHYAHVAIPDDRIPTAGDALFQHALETYASETNKVISVWLDFQAEDLPFTPHPKSTTVEGIMRHQILSERRFFAEFIGTPEPPVQELLPSDTTPAGYASRLRELALNRLDFLAGQPQSWWLETTSFFDVKRQRIWIFWRRVLHTAHHRTQLTVYLRMLDKAVPSTYGPTADVTWDGADPTNTIEAASRR
ncbi:MAG: DinB family protein [Blastocatellia bacterium]|nr:DinB family protein [Blastocatellia bacterium]